MVFGVENANAIPGITRALAAVGATSGDTGSAAIDALAGRAKVDLFMLHPKGRVSEVQRRQMTTVADANVHNHRRCPMFLLGHANGALKGNLHIKAADGTPMANAMLGALRGVGLELNAFGDSTAVMDLKTVPATTAAE